MPHALLLSGSLGQGHDVMAAACADSLHDRGWTTSTVDAMALLGRRSGAAGEAVFRRLLAIPGVYDAFHFSALRPGNRLALYTEKAAVARLAPRIKELLEREPADLVVSVFATAAGAVDALHREGRQVPPHMVFCTDVTPHRLWVHPSTDVFLVTSQAAAAGVRRYRPDAAIAVVPAPLRPAFYTPPTKQQARQEFGVPDDARCVLLMSGAWGLGPVAAAAAALGAAGVHVLAVAGRNQELEARLRAVARREPRVHAFGYSDRVPSLMTAADLVVTSSGDTCSEARAIGRRLLLLDVVPGHGRDNLQHELELGHADVTGAAPRDVVRAALAALERPTPDPSIGSVRAPWEAAFGTALSSVGLS
ncbi:putative glycosyl transferase [Catenulispora acidiphila DSM 44928]|uniref:Putative glycosyl transferase n=1 Tax=Catenulispora acidiphila (strain DSM 44928 / JCM 14897 / NBRC 102108 / NRRL B-24433 / ID139908) TaxID=479433 RepID=C7Q023_CATAD|nr:glycosyltransferase [Catenulispora acidiphila]ACU75516.1 putative glycosyl transferase [Catenulispora acidiphila DSM 44928]